VATTASIPVRVHLFAAVKVLPEPVAIWIRALGLASRTHGKAMDKDQKRRAKEELVTGQELVPETARLCAMNLHLHGIGGAMPAR
jgi:hypothetical protein